MSDQFDANNGDAEFDKPTHKPRHEGEPAWEDPGIPGYDGFEDQPPDTPWSTREPSLPDAVPITPTERR